MRRNATHRSQPRRRTRCMPSHIFTRVGYWKESIASHTASARAAKEAKQLPDQLHAMDYLVYAHLQLSQDNAARAVIDEMMGITGFPPAALGAVFAQTASPARYMIERRDWKGAAGLTARPSQFPFVDAMTHFARALGATRSGQPEAAGAEIAKLAEARDKLRMAKNDYWAEQVDVQWQAANAWALHAAGKQDDALAAMRAAAEAEDLTAKHPVTPGRLVPARELYGAMLFERGHAMDALDAFEATLKKEPNRLAAIIGAAKAAAKVGDGVAARRHYASAVALTEQADAGRAELAEARAFIATTR
jgi:tetratricopeptide (TPR) repeat protein